MTMYILLNVYLTENLQNISTLVATINHYHPCHKVGVYSRPRNQAAIAFLGQRETGLRRSRFSIKIRYSLVTVSRRGNGSRVCRRPSNVAERKKEERRTRERKKASGGTGKKSKEQRGDLVSINV